MITQLNLRHFKCFKELSLRLAPLTLLSGTNSSGKSSIIRALILIGQVLHTYPRPSRLILNDETLQMGIVRDVVDQVYGDSKQTDDSKQMRQMGLGIIHKNQNIETNYEWLFSGRPSDGDMSITPSPDNDHRQSGVNDPSVTTFPNHWSHIGAERIGPREFYPSFHPQMEQVVGATGEYAVSMMYHNRDRKVIDALLDSKEPPELPRQVEVRMNEFFPNCVLNLTSISDTNQLTLGIRTSKETNFHRPTHVGFGLTQVLPIVVAVLSATEGDLLLIENPESHLHPRAQSLMGEFLAKAAGAGIQIILETHSDHILNGIRRSVKNKTLSSQQTALYFFRPRQPAVDAPNLPSQVEQLFLDSNGNIDRWPQDFFDQIDKDMNYFAGWGE